MKCDYTKPIRSRQELLSLVNDISCLEAYINDQLQNELGESWNLMVRGKLHWTLEKMHPDEGAGDNLEYDITYSTDLKTFIIRCENNDAGALGIDKAIMKARVIHSDVLIFCDFGDIFRIVLETAKPNQWGLA